MSVHVIADNPAKVPALRSVLEPRFAVTSEMLADTGLRRNGIEAAVVAVDVAAVDNIAALKAISPRLARVPKRVFLIEGKGRLAIVQAYALGATYVLTHPLKPSQLLARLAPADADVVSDGGS